MTRHLVCLSFAVLAWLAAVLPPVTPARAGEPDAPALPTRAVLPGVHAYDLPDGGPELPALVTDPAAVFTEPAVPRPGYLLTTFIDPTFGLVVERIANNIGASTTPVAGSWGSDARHVYSKQQPWSSDYSMISIENSGSPSPLILDGTTYRPRLAPCGNYDLWDYRWHPSHAHPHEQINVNSAGTELMWFDVTTCTKTRSWSLPITSNYGIGSGEGNPSNDGRYVAIGNDTQMLIVDMDPQPPFAPYPNKRIGPPVTIAPNCGASDCTIDWVSVSASGKYAVVNYNGDFPRVYDVNPQTLALTPHAYAGSTPECNGHSPAMGFILDLGHADFALNPFDNNEDVLIGQRSDGCPSSVNGQQMSGVVMVRLRDGFVTMLTDPNNEAFPHHISCRNLDRPGWAYVSYYPSPGQRFNDEIVAVKLDGSKACERVAHMHSDFNNCYRCEPHAVPSPDGMRVIFASNWALNCGSGCGSTSDIKDYVVLITGAPSAGVQSTSPPRAELAFEHVFPNPATVLPSIEYSLACGAPATLELVDAAGRRILSQDLGAPGPGHHELQIGAGPGLAPGAYWLRLSQAGRSVTSRIVIVR